MRRTWRCTCGRDRSSRARQKPAVDEFLQRWTHHRDGRSETGTDHAARAPREARLLVDELLVELLLVGFEGRVVVLGQLPFESLQVRLGLGLVVVVALLFLFLFFLLLGLGLGVLRAGLVRVALFFRLLLVLFFLFPLLLLALLAPAKHPLVGAEILPVAPSFALSLKRMTPACQRCKNYRRRSSSLRDRSPPTRLRGISTSRPRRRRDPPPRNIHVVAAPRPRRRGYPRRRRGVAATRLPAEYPRDRRYQYGAFCPIFRTHGDRSPGMSPLPARGSRYGEDGAVCTAPEGHAAGAPTEPWTFGNETEPLLAEMIRLRASLRPYIQELAANATAAGAPPMRPLFYEFPDDPTSWLVEDAFMFGPTWLVAPILELGARSRWVYFPGATTWRHHFTGEVYRGGQNVSVPAPLAQFPLFARI